MVIFLARNNTFAKVYLKSWKIPKHLVKPQKIIIQTIEICYAENYDAQRFTKEIWLLIEISLIINYLLNFGSVSEQVLGGLNNAMPQERTVVNMTSGEKNFDDVLETLEKHYPTVVSSRRVNFFNKYQ